MKFPIMQCKALLYYWDLSGRHGRIVGNNNFQLSSRNHKITLISQLMGDTVNKKLFARVDLDIKHSITTRVLFSL